MTVFESPSSILIESSFCIYNDATYCLRILLDLLTRHYNFRISIRCKFVIDLRSFHIDSISQAIKYILRY